MTTEKKASSSVCERPDPWTHSGPDGLVKNQSVCDWGQHPASPPSERDKTEDRGLFLKSCPIRELILRVGFLTETLFSVWDFRKGLSKQFWLTNCQFFNSPPWKIICIYVHISGRWRSVSASRTTGCCPWAHWGMRGHHLGQEALIWPETQIKILLISHGSHTVHTLFKCTCLLKMMWQQNAPLS